jgi:hypothetical protein
MQLSELIEAILNIIAGPTNVLENCDQAQALIGKMKNEEENIGQGRSLWQADKFLRSVVSKLCEK